MESKARQQREYELVRLLLGDRSLFREFCTACLNLRPAETKQQADRDLLLAVLDHEFPPLKVRWCFPAGRQRPSPI